jgi:undecaprenyl-diphosphatase
MIGAIESRTRRALAWARENSNLILLVGALIVVLGIWGFAKLASEVLEGDTQAFDDWAIKALRRPDGTPTGPTWLQEVARDITALGGVFVLSLVTFAVAGYLAIVRKHHAMWLVLLATGGGLVISTVLKNLFNRDRPQLVPHLSIVHTSSFPSGHSMLSAVVYLTLGAMLARLVPNRAAKIYFIVLAMALSLLVGISRVYLGVHYPTDVLAGWTAGCVWATVCYLAARQLQRRGAVERDVDEPGGHEAKAASEAPAATA